MPLVDATSYVREQQQVLPALQASLLSLLPPPLRTDDRLLPRCASSDEISVREARTIGKTIKDVDGLIDARLSLIHI